MTGKKLKSVQELEEHGEQMVKIAKVKPKPKAKKKVVSDENDTKVDTASFPGGPTRGA